MSQDNIKFAYWVPNVSGGLVISKIEQRTSWDIDYNRKLAQIAEKSKVSKAWLGRHAICALLERAKEDDGQIPLPLAAVGGR